jgi:hypothetical protein
MSGLCVGATTQLPPKVIGPGYLVAAMVKLR